jgi:hypothetical protein
MKNHKVLYINSIVFLVIFILFFIFKKTGVAAGFSAGYLVGFLNLFLSQMSLASMFSQPAGGDVIKKTFSYIMRFFVKMTLLAVVLIVFLKYLKLDWLGMLIGLLSSTFVYLVLVSRNNRCQSSQKQ